MSWNVLDREAFFLIHHLPEKKNGIQSWFYTAKQKSKNEEDLKKEGRKLETLKQF